MSNLFQHHATKTCFILLCAAMAAATGSIIWVQTTINHQMDCPEPPLAINCTEHFYNTTTPISASSQFWGAMFAASGALIIGGGAAACVGCAVPPPEDKKEIELNERSPILA